MQTAQEIFVNFLQREGWTKEQATFELRFIDGKTEHEYVFKTPRIGSTKTLSRPDKMSIYLLWQNAQNHATFTQ